MVHFQLVVEEVQHRTHVVRGVVGEEGGVGGDAESGVLGRLDGFHGLVEHAFLADGLVVSLAQSVDVNGEGEVGRRGEERELALEQQGVGAQIDELAPPHELVGDLVNLGVHQRLAAGDGHHGRAALLDGGHGLLDGHALAQRRDRMLDLAAAGAGEVAGIERLELDDERELFAPAQPLCHEIAGNGHRLPQRNAHERLESGSQHEKATTFHGLRPVRTA